MNFLYQRCYTNLLRYNGETRVGGWTACAVSRDIPQAAQRACDQFQRADADEKNRDATDATGRRPLRLYEFLCDGQFAYVIRTRYGLLDHEKRANVFSHAYIVPLYGKDCALEHPEYALSLDASCFAQDVSDAERLRDPTAESKLLAERAEGRLTDGVFTEWPYKEWFNFQNALDADALRFSTNRKKYRTLLECVYAHMDEQRETGRRLPPLYVQYDAGADADDTMRRLLCAIFYALPYWMRRELKASNWCGIDNAPKDLMFVTDNAVNLSSGNGGRYVALSTEETSLKGKYLGRAKRCGYLSYAAETLDFDRFPTFFDGLDRIAKALGDGDASSEAIRRLVWQCYWDDAAGRFTDAPRLDGLSEKDASRLLSDVTQSGAYSETLRTLVREVRAKAGKLNSDLTRALSEWEAECDRLNRPHTSGGSSQFPTTPQPQPVQHPPQPVQPPTQAVGPTTTQTVQQPPQPVQPPTQAAPPPPTQDVQQPPPQTYAPPPQATNYTLPNNITDIILAAYRQGQQDGQQPAPPQAQAVPKPQQPPSQTYASPQPVTPTYMPPPQAQAVTPPPESPSYVPPPPLKAIDWEAVDDRWRNMPTNARENVLNHLQKILNKGTKGASTDFKGQLDQKNDDDKQLYLLLLIDREASGAANSTDVLHAYCLNLLNKAKNKSVASRWNALSDVCSCAQREREDRITDDRLKDFIKKTAWDLFIIEGFPGGPAGRATQAVRKYDDIITRLYPDDGDPTRLDLLRKARETYWSKADYQWKHFKPDMLEEYEAFDDGQWHLFPHMVRLIEKFSLKKSRTFLTDVSRFFQRANDEAPAPYAEDTKLYTVQRIYEELNRQCRNELPQTYKNWMALAALAEDEKTLEALEALYDAVSRFDVKDIYIYYSSFLWQCDDKRERERVKEIGCRVVMDASFKSDAKTMVPLDLWIMIGKSRFDISGKLHLENYFKILEDKPDALILNLKPADAVRDSELMSSPSIQSALQAYINTKSATPRVRKAAQGWYDAVTGKSKKFGVF